MSFSDLTTLSKVALGIAIASLFVSVNFVETSTVNGVGSCFYIDYAKIVLGGLAVMIGSIGTALAIRFDGPQMRSTNMLGAGIATLVGLYSLLVGLGVIGGPC